MDAKQRTQKQAGATPNNVIPFPKRPTDAQRSEMIEDVCDLIEDALDNFGREFSREFLEDTAEHCCDLLPLSFIAELAARRIERLAHRAVRMEVAADLDEGRGRVLALFDAALIEHSDAQLAEGD